MGFALGAATGKRSGPIDGPGWTLLDPAASMGAKGFASAGPLLSTSPRRTLRVEFTCNKCWERTTRAINPQAYKTGTVFVQVNLRRSIALLLLPLDPLVKYSESFDVMPSLSISPQLGLPAAFALSRVLSVLES